MPKSNMCIDAQVLSGFTQSPGLLKVTPISHLEQVAKLCRGDADAVARRRRPHEAAPVQPLRIQRQSEPVVPQAFQEIASTPAKDVKIASEGIAPEPLLDKKRQPVHAAAHIGVASRDPYPNAGQDGDHRRSSTSRTRASASASTAPSTTTRRPRPSSIAMRPWAACRGVLRRNVGSPFAAGSGVSTAGTKAGAGLAATPSTFSARRHARSWKREIPCRRAVADTNRGAARLSITTRSFSSSDHRRRRPSSTISRRPGETLCLLLSISTVSTARPPPHKAALAAGVLRS